MSIDKLREYLFKHAKKIQTSKGMFINSIILKGTGKNSNKYGLRPIKEHTVEIFLAAEEIIAVELL